MVWLLNRTCIAMFDRMSSASISRVASCGIVNFFLGLAFAAICRADQPREVAVKLNISPAIAPVPALKYQLLPDIGERRPGNPILDYWRCLMNFELFFHKQLAEKRERWLEMPLRELLPPPDDWPLAPCRSARIS